MRIITETVRIEATPALKSYIEEKLGPIGKFVKKFEKQSEAEIFLEISRTTKHHHKGLVFRAEANLKIAGTTLRAEANAEDARAAIDKVKDELKSEISRFKRKMTMMTRRGNRRAE